MCCRNNLSIINENKNQLYAMRNQLLKSSSALTAYDVMDSLTNSMASIPMVNDAAGMYNLAKQAHIQDEMLERFVDMTSDMMAKGESDTSSAERIVDELLDQTADANALNMPDAPGSGGAGQPALAATGVASRV